MLKILRFPHPFLRTKAAPVESVTQELARLGEDMLQLMYESTGVGLAAVQVGKPFALLTADTRRDLQHPYYKPAPTEEEKKSSPSKATSLKNPPPGAEARRPPSSEKTAKKNEIESRYDRSRLKCELEMKVRQPLILFNPKITKRKGTVLFQEGCLSFPSYYAEVKRAEIVTVEALDREGKPITITTDGLLSICLQHEIDHLHGRLFIDHLSFVKAARLKDEIKKRGYPDDNAGGGSSGGSVSDFRGGNKNGGAFRRV